VAHDHPFPDKLGTVNLEVVRNELTHMRKKVFEHPVFFERPAIIKLKDFVSEIRLDQSLKISCAYLRKVIIPQSRAEGFLPCL
jgi:hypothetical protein